MGTLRWALAALLLVPLADIALLIFVAGRFGVPATVALVVVTALVGLLLVRAEGRHTMRRLQRRVATGELPADELLDGGLLIAAGAFLLTPGLVTDLLGFLLAVPPTRLLVRSGLKRWIVLPTLDARTGGLATGRIYTAGFPEEGTEDARGDRYDLGADAYDIDFDDDRSEKGNA